MADDSATQGNDTTEDAAEPVRFPLFYANSAGIRGGAFDVALDFLYLVSPMAGEAGPQPAQPLVRVAMSWEHARALHTLLGGALANYEEQVGSIPDIDKLKVEEGAQ